MILGDAYTNISVASDVRVPEVLIDNTNNSKDASEIRKLLYYIHSNLLLFISQLKTFLIFTPISSTSTKITCETGLISFRYVIHPYRSPVHRKGGRKGSDTSPGCRPATEPADTNKHSVCCKPVQPLLVAGDFFLFS